MHVHGSGRFFRNWSRHCLYCVFVSEIIKPCKNFDCLQEKNIPVHNRSEICFYTISSVFSVSNISNIIRSSQCFIPTTSSLDSLSSKRGNNCFDRYFLFISSRNVKQTICFKIATSWWDLSCFIWSRFLFVPTKTLLQINWQKAPIV